MAVKFLNQGELLIQEFIEEAEIGN